MANHQSDQYAKLATTPPGMNPSGDMRGRLRVAFWTFTTPGGGVGINDTIELVELPVGARLLGGKTVNEAMTSGAGAAQYDIGYAGDAARYGAAIDVDAAGEDFFGNTFALKYGDVMTVRRVLMATVKTEAWAAAKRFDGEIRFVID